MLFFKKQFNNIQNIIRDIIIMKIILRQICSLLLIVFVHVNVTHFTAFARCHAVMITRGFISTNFTRDERFTASGSVRLARRRRSQQTGFWKTKKKKPKKFSFSISEYFSLLHRINNNWTRYNKNNNIELYSSEKWASAAALWASK